MIKRVLLLCFIIAAIFLFGCALETDYQIESPDGELRVQVWLNDENRLYYSISRMNETVLEASQLGIIRGDSDFSNTLSFVSASSVNEIDEQYEMLQGKRLDRHYRANEQLFHFTGELGEPMEVVFRVSNDGVAFQYRFPEEDDALLTIEEEKSFFNLPSESRAWLTPMAVVNTGWSETNPSYEEYYELNIAVGTPSTLGVGWSYPALFQTPSSDWVLITETGMDGNYPGTRLRTVDENGLYQVGFPDEEEVVTDGIRGPEFKKPWRSPWRIITIGGLDTITESTLGTDLADPAEYEDVSYIEASRVSWSWAKLKDESVNYDTQIEFIDYAADMGWEATLVDVNWDQNIGYDGIQELADYASERGIGLWLWYNSSGDWNLSPYTPKSALLTHEDRMAEFDRISEMGIKGIKVDFFPGDGQSSLQYYIDIFEDAHQFELMVNTHGSTIPRGWHRTYPNLMTMESVRGFEFKTFEQANQDETASHATILPFTRNVFDPMDYTPMSLDEIPDIERVTTSPHELAHPVLFWSGAQNFAETPAGMETVPEFVKEFVKKIPAAWEETKFVDGFPGELAVIARKKGESWFVGGVNGEKIEKTVTISLPFLEGEKTGYLISDGDDKFSYERTELTISSDSKLEVEMSSNGGFVIYLE